MRDLHMANEKFFGYLLTALMAAYAYTINSTLVLAIVIAVVLLFVIIILIELSDEDIVEYVVMYSDMPENISGKTSMLLVMGFGIFLVLVTVIYNIL